MMQRVRLLVLGIVGFLSVFFAHGSWLNRLLAFALCGVLSAGSGLCLANVAQFSGQAIATTPELVAEGRATELTGDVPNAPNNNFLGNPTNPNTPSIPSYPREVSPNTPVREEFRNDPDVNRIIDSAIETPAPIDSAQRIRDEFKSPIYTYYINGIRTDMGAYGQNVEAISTNLLPGIVDPPRISAVTFNRSGVSNSHRPSVIPFYQLIKILLDNGGGDLVEAQLQIQDFFRPRDGAELVDSVIEDIKQKDKEESEKAKTTCEDSPRAKFLIIGHSQGTLFIQDVANILPQEYSDRTVLFAMAPFTNFQRITGKVRGFDYLLREDDFPTIFNNQVGISIPGGAANLPRLPMLLEYQNDKFVGDSSLQIREKQALDSHSIANYLGSPTNPAYANDAQRSLNRARASVGRLLNFDSGKYEKKQGCSQTATQTPPRTVATDAPKICRVPEGFWNAGRTTIYSAAGTASVTVSGRINCIVSGPVMTAQGIAEGETCGACYKSGNNLFGQPISRASCRRPEGDRTTPVTQCPANWATGGEYQPTPEDILQQVLPGVPTTPEELLQRVLPNIQLPRF